MDCEGRRAGRDVEGARGIGESWDWEMGMGEAEGCWDMLRRQVYGLSVLFKNYEGAAETPSLCADRQISLSDDTECVEMKRVAGIHGNGRPTDKRKLISSASRTTQEARGGW